MATFEELKNKDPDTEAYLAKVAKAESGNNPNAKNPYGSATGLFQFVESTWKGLIKKYNLNYTLEDRKNPEKAANVMRLFTQENENQIRPLVGRDLNDGDRYLAHFLGAQGAKKFFTAYNTNPNLPISVVMSPAALNANKQVVYDKQGKLKSVSDVYGWATGKMNEKVEPKIYNQESIEPTKSYNTYITPTPGELETSETEYVEESDNQEVVQAKQDLIEKSFIEDFKSTIEKQQLQIQELQNSLKPSEQPVQQQQEQFVLDEMPDPYNYIELDSGLEEFQRGGITATRQDSLNLLNNTKKVLKYYKDRNYSEETFSEFKNVHSLNDEAYNSKKKRNFYTAQLPGKKGEQISGNLPEELYRKTLDKNRYYQRENADGILDTRSPMQLYDRRIEPNRAYSGVNNDESDIMSGDAVLVPTYDILKITPFDMLSESQKKDRVRIYGRDGVPDSYRPKYNNYNRQILQVRNEQPVKELNPKDIQMLTPQPIQGTEMLQRTEAQIPVSFDVTSQRYNMTGENPYYNFNGQGVDLETALRAKMAAEAYNTDIQNRYGNEEALQNQKAQERLRQLRQEIIITPNYEQGGIIEDDRGQWAYPGEITKINSGNITMEGVNYPVLGISQETGEEKMMYPDKNYFFKNTKNVLEIPMTRKINRRFNV